MSGLLQGHPSIMSAPADAFIEEYLREFALFASEDLASYRFAPATSRLARANTENVYAAIWYKKDRGLIYLGNYSPKPARGAFRFDPRFLGVGPTSRVSHITYTALPGHPRAAKLTNSELKWLGVPFALKPWGTALYRVEV